MSSTHEINKHNAQHTTDDLAGEDYQLHVAGYVDEYRPKGAIEAHLVESVASIAWRLNRVVPLENSILALGSAETQHHILRAVANLSLYSDRLVRQFEFTVNQLRDLQKSRRSEERSDRNA